MLRIHFTEVDLARTRLASRPDPLWEIASSLHRFQTRRGRWAYAGWHRSAARRLTESGLAPTVRLVARAMNEVRSLLRDKGTADVQRAAGMTDRDA